MISVAAAGRRDRLAAPVVRLASVDSTQRVAWEAAEAGAADGTVVLADEQTAGRGRRGDTWVAPPGTSLLASIVLRPALAPGRLPLLSYAAALAVGDALQRVAALPSRLKWPNDVRASGGKIAGILLEARGDRRPVTVVGIGINLAQRAFPAHLAGATSVARETGVVPDRDALLAALRDALETWRATLEREGFEPLRRTWLARAETIGRAVSVGGRTGMAVDLDSDGALVLETPQGVARVFAGSPVEQDAVR
ncbi:MAG: biotin--[acetyl-CoA-carboxylase] ligase [Candidatus Rokubacteria bacterium]|nr:biotin--[acetyl-CoA-carboxylase] ligase [Candidatus Rokubacteria bacterium]MBI3825849.1 biotin--[acetyl-CoA-carboxylase] ligase [Candidatus Rokubacteria bacterium]